MAHRARPAVIAGSPVLVVCALLFLLVPSCGGSKGAAGKDGSASTGGAQTGVGGSGTGGGSPANDGASGNPGTGGGTVTVATGGSVGTGGSGTGGGPARGTGGAAFGGASGRETGGSKGTGGSAAGGAGGTLHPGTGGAGGAGTTAIDASATGDTSGMEVSTDGSNVINCSSGSRCELDQVPVRWTPTVGTQECTCEPNPCESGMPNCDCAGSICAKRALTCVGFMPGSGFLQCGR